MKIGLVQYNPDWENKESNKKKLQKLFTELPDDVSLLIFPELTLTGFTMRSSLFAEELEGDSINFFKGIAREKNCHIITGLILEIEGKYFNSAIHIDNSGEIIESYNKIHPFSMSGEDKNYTAGNLPAITQVNQFKIGLSICYDLRFPELFRFYGKEKVDLIVTIANWPIPRIEHWRTLIKARAIENQCYIAGVNRVGKDLCHDYNGYSSVYNPMGNEIISLIDKEEIIIANINIEQVRETRNNLPFLNDIKLI
ncbi:MAG: hypothetical protein C4539_08560 [Ignavibacteriales bacterium]|nr:MAG: hypothetical protein C4539_08560 [Ignavibacteriales bacterium]